MKYLETLKEAWKRSPISEDGIFQRIFNETRPAPWGTEHYVDTRVLDNYYFGIFSGRKYISPLVEDLLDAAGTDELSSLDKEFIASNIYKFNIKKWERLFKLQTIEYSPIENYDRTEERTTTTNRQNKGENNEKIKHGETVETTGNQSVTVTETGENKTAYGKTNATTTNDNSENNASIYGFDSDAAVNKDKNTMQQIGEVNSTDGGTDTTTETANRTDTATSSNNETHGGVTEKINTYGDGYDETNIETLKIHGNIGVTRTQEMIKDEIELWNNWDIFLQMFRDVDELLTIGVR